MTDHVDSALLPTVAAVPASAAILANASIVRAVAIPLKQASKIRRKQPSKQRKYIRHDNWVSVLSCWLSMFTEWHDHHSFTLSTESLLRTGKSALAQATLDAMPCMSSKMRRLHAFVVRVVDRTNKESPLALQAAVEQRRRVLSSARCYRTSKFSPKISVIVLRTDNREKMSSFWQRLSETATAMLKELSEGSYFKRREMFGREWSTEACN